MTVELCLRYMLANLELQRTLRHQDNQFSITPIVSPSRPGISIEYASKQ